LNDIRLAVSYSPIMTKPTGLALIAAVAFSVTSAFAGEKDKSCCATHAKGDTKACMTQTFAKMNLSSEQKTKLEALHAESDKAGCTKESMDKMLKSAESFLSKEQMATLKAECSKMDRKDAKA
jgi:hypothetical protein